MNNGCCCWWVIDDKCARIYCVCIVSSIILLNPNPAAYLKSLLYVFRAARGKPLNFQSQIRNESKTHNTGAASKTTTTKFLIEIMRFSAQNSDRRFNRGFCLRPLIAPVGFIRCFLAYFMVISIESYTFFILFFRGQSNKDNHDDDDVWKRCVDIWRRID